MNLSIVIPAYNEAKRITNTLQLILRYFAPKKLAYELIVIDDGSKDDTLKIVQALAAEHQEIKVISYRPNRGKGHAVRQGVEAAQGQLILFSDADLSTPIEEYDHLRQVLDSGYDLVLGSRALKTSEVKVHQPLYRELMGKTFNLLIKLLLFKGFNDTQCGFKLFKAGPAKDLFQRIRVKHFAFDVELVYLALRRGYKVKEEGVKWLNSPGSRVSPLKDSALMLLDLFRIRFFSK